MAGKVFDLQFEIGTNGPPKGNFYAKVVIGNGVLFESDSSSPAAAIAKVAIDMETAGMWTIMVANSALSASGSVGKPSPKRSKPDPKAPKKKPMELTQVTHPDCQLLCTSFDHFGKTKCKSMCGQRTGL